MKGELQQFLCLVLLINTLFGIHRLKAQQAKVITGGIKGVIVDASTQSPIPYATIVVKSKQDQITLTGGISNDKGKFEIEAISSGDIVVLIQFIGYKTIRREISLKNTIEDMGILSLSEEAQALASVDIIAERSTIEQRIDRKVINVGKDLTTAGASAADIMSNIPSVDVDQDGNVSLRGNTNVQVFIDGKPTNISSDQLLQQIPSTSIKKIELITNPSAKYTPEGMSGIINVVLRKEVTTGFNGSVNTGFIVWDHIQFNGSTDLNYKTGDINIYGSYGTNLRKRRVIGNIRRPLDASNEDWYSNRDGNSQLFKIGLDYTIGKKSKLSLYTNQNIFENDILADNQVSFTGATAFINQHYTSLRENTNASYNIDFKQEFNKGQTLEFEADYNRYKGSDNADFSVGNEQGSNIYLEDVSDTRDNTVLNLDYVYPISKKTTLEIGAEARLQEIDNTFMTTNLHNEDATYSYSRDIYSLYTTFGQNLGKWSYQLGARFENYEATGDFKESNKEPQLFEDVIFSIYPSAFIKYTPNIETQNNSYQLSYSRRVDRPGLNQITPIRVWSSARVTNVGNPSLNPQFTNSIEANYTRRLPKGSITTGIFYRSISDEITRFAFQDPELPAQILFSYNNYKDNTAYGFEISGSYKPFSWWNGNVSFDVYAQTQKGVTEGEEIAVDNVLYNMRMTHSFKVNKKFSLQLFGMYRGANDNLQYETKALYFVNAGARYSFANRSGTVSLNMNDVFNTQQFSFNAYRPITQIGTFNWNSRTVYLGLSYRFGKKHTGLKRKKRDANEKKGGDFL
ncbi:TonB-dependent receptor [Aquimarina sp. TRL1]|uniref:outer membrane beta-barrel protein n=1 Tax=Aquimarina sp. (strain TRL1) TaxID=2736252 RepID=UPI00158850F2|nr:outer membrane beta-barrel protein [Aquimarina sp. TRL1]QKX06000.1 TonB-dependent receptor [Aquimarina sp. TRL1]